MRINILLLLIILTLCPIHANNNEGHGCVVLETIDGEKLEFLLSEVPQFQNDGSAISLTTNSTSVQVSYDMIKKVYFGAQNMSTTKVKEDMLKENNRLINMKDGYVNLSGFNPNESVCIYDLSGKQLLKSSISQCGDLSIPFSSLPIGAYIIRTKNQSIKVIRR